MDKQPLNKTFVYKNAEVKLTGRVAKKDMEKTSRSKGPTVSLLLEITPTSAEKGSWKAWVRKDELYEITDTVGDVSTDTDD